jgi:N-hydroxyarylamine O-acetyltransferase
VYAGGWRLLQGEGRGTLSRIERDATHTTLLADEGEWFAALADVFGLDLRDVDAPERRALWERVQAQHEVWAAQQDR